MIWISKKHSGITSEMDTATGTYPDGLFPLLAAKELAAHAERTFRHSYGKDHSLASKREQPEYQAR
jgi:hypothetical protein